MTFLPEPLEPRRLHAAQPAAAVPPSPDLAPSTDCLVFSAVQGAESAAQRVKLQNRGRAKLTIESIGVDGADAAAFAVYARRTTSVVLRPGASVKLKVAFRPTGAAVFAAGLRVASNDPDAPVAWVPLQGLGTAGRFEDAEPSFQRILNAYRIPVNVGDADPATARLDGPAASDEVVMPLLQKAGPGRVRLTPLAVYSWEWRPHVAQVGWYDASRPAALRKALTVRSGSAQTTAPRTSGKTTFDPRDATFGLYSVWRSETHGPVFSQDGRNAWDRTDDAGRKVRFYPYKTPDGAVVANAYVVAMEQAFNSDFQDAVFVIENVSPAGTG